MMIVGGRTAGWRQLGLALIALGLAFRILVAPGMMPVASPAGLTLTLCTAQGPVTYTLDVHGKKPVEEAHDPCPYGALAAVPLVPVPVLPPVVGMVLVFLPLFGPQERQPHLGVPAPPPPATGPPFLA